MPVEWLHRDEHITTFTLLTFRSTLCLLLYVELLMLQQDLAGLFLYMQLLASGVLICSKQCNRSSLLWTRPMEVVMHQKHLVQKS